MKSEAKLGLVREVSMRSEGKACSGVVPDDRLPEFVAAVKRGIASAERGDFVEHEEVLARIKRLL